MGCRLNVKADEVDRFQLADDNIIFAYQGTGTGSCGRERDAPAKADACMPSPQDKLRPGF